MYNILTDGEITRLFSIFKDTQETFIQKLYRALPDIIYVLNLDTYGIIYSSRLIPLELGYSAAESQAMEHPILDILHPADKEKFLKHLQIVKSIKAAEVVEIEYRLIRHDGKIAWFIDRDVVFTRKINGEAATKIGITHDITRRKEHEARLIKQAEIISETEVLACSGSWEYEHSSKTFNWSKGMYRLFNLPVGTAVQPGIYNDYAIPGDSHIADRVVNGIEQADAAINEVLRIDVDGQVRHLKIKGAPLKNNQSQEKTIIGVDVDISELEKKEFEMRGLNLELSSKNREVELLHSDLKAFTDISIADIQANLTYLYTAYETILTREAGQFSNNGKGLARKIQGTLQRMNLLTKDVLSYVQIGEGRKIENVSLDEVVNQVLVEFTDVITADSIHIERNKLGSVEGDLHLVHILLRNLIDNAIKFRKPDTQHVITITSTHSNNADSLSPDTLKLTIHDNGKGLQPGDDEKIFDLFYKNHYGFKMRGSGLGLAVARKIMSIHDGAISVDNNNINQGAAFICSFKRS